MIRLPIGRIVLPVAAGDIGYALDDHNSGFIPKDSRNFPVR